MRAPYGYGTPSLRGCHETNWSESSEVIGEIAFTCNGAALAMAGAFVLRRGGGMGGMGTGDLQGRMNFESQYLQQPATLGRAFGDSQDSHPKSIKFEAVP